MFGDQSPAMTRRSELFPVPLSPVIKTFSPLITFRVRPTKSKNLPFSVTERSLACYASCSNNSL